jgi:hypothetical protein
MTVPSIQQDEGDIGLYVLKYVDIPEFGARAMRSHPQHCVEVDAELCLGSLIYLGVGG